MRSAHWQAEHIGSPGTALRDGPTSAGDRREFSRRRPESLASPEAQERRSAAIREVYGATRHRWNNSRAVSVSRVSFARGWPPEQFLRLKQNLYRSAHVSLRA